MKFNSRKYREILCAEFPDFICKYLSLEILVRLKGIGLLCGTDWTALFKNKFFYSRFEHSVNCALIVWNFTRDKKQTLAALLHDVSTPAFSHAIDFKNGDALTQTSTESANAKMLHEDTKLARLLAQDNLTVSDVDDYHAYPICDNEIPQLSADRLEYMFPSGAALQGIFSLRSVRYFYEDLTLAQNEFGQSEFAFRTKKIALEYFLSCLKVGKILQRDEDKITMELLARVVEKALRCGALFENELFELSEKEIITRWDKMLFEHAQSATRDLRDFLIHYKTFRTMKKIRRSQSALPNHFCVNLEVKRRYINPLVLAQEGKAGNEQLTKKIEGLRSKRICDISERAMRLQKEFLSFHDAPFGCVKLRKSL